VGALRLQAAELATWLQPDLQGFSHKSARGIVFMKIHSTSWTVMLVLFLALLPAGCQKQGVQAANDNGANAGQAKPSLLIWDRDFLVGAAKLEARERSLSRVAWDRAVSADVKEYAHAVMDNHADSLRRLRDLMNQKGLDQAPAIEEAKFEGEYRLDRLSGAAFDHEYISFMSADTQQAVTQFRQASETADDPDVRAYARAVLPVLVGEREKAADLEKKLAQQPRQ
jgi:putative membrane protein